jgi:hypothetical protein
MRAASPSALKVDMNTGTAGLYLGVIQFFFALSWTVYAIFLPQLAAQASLALQYPEGFPARRPQ